MMQRARTYIGFIAFLLLSSLVIPQANAAGKRSIKAIPKPPKLSKLSMMYMSRYVEKVNDLVQKKWRIKQLNWLQVHNRSAAMRLWLNKKGKLLRFKFLASSGHPVYDMTLVRAIKLTTFPKPPRRLRKYLKRYGVGIVFRKRAFNKKHKRLIRKYNGNTKIPNWIPPGDKPRFFKKVSKKKAKKAKKKKK